MRLYPLPRLQIDYMPLNCVVICERTGLPLGEPIHKIAIDANGGYVIGFEKL